MSDSLSFDQNEVTGLASSKIPTLIYPRRRITASRVLQETKN